MKKGFTMIELIFVIVILGILASVAIPRLAGTKADAEISAAVANLRTIVSDANAYYAAKGFDTKTVNGTNGGSTDVFTTKWNEITNVPLENADQPVGSVPYGYLKVDGEKCIELQIHNRIGDFPARIQFTPHPTNKNNGVCKQVLDSAPIKAYTESTALKGLPRSIALGSSISIYPSSTTTSTTQAGGGQPTNKK